MSMPGLPSIEKNPARWSSSPSSSPSSLLSRSISGSYFANAAVGVLAGVAVACARTPIHLPGHKAIFWMAPVLIARIITRARGGALVGTTAAATSALCLGGRIAGGIAFLPLVLLAGATLDAGVEFANRRPLPLWQKLLVLGTAGLVGNMFCFVKRLFDPMGSLLSAANLKEIAVFAASHALFGLLAGVLGSSAGYCLLKVNAQPDAKVFS